jgi:hypothetical protein
VRRRGIVEHEVEAAQVAPANGATMSSLLVTSVGTASALGVLLPASGGLVSRLLAPARQGHLVAGLQQGERRGTADAAARAGDDCDLSAHGLVPPRRNGPYQTARVFR